AAVDDDLHGSDEFRAQEQIQTRESDHHDDQREGAVNRMLLQNQAERANNRQRRQHIEDDELRRHFQLLRSRITKLVMMTLTMETGSSSFQPKDINWS